MTQDKFDTSTGKPILIVEFFGAKKTLSLKTNIFSIGRDPKCSLFLNEKLISRHHATIAWLRDKNNYEKYAYWIIDGKGARKRSKNGVFVNGSRTVLHRLHSGDVITFASKAKITYTYLSDITNYTKSSLWTKRF